MWLELVGIGLVIVASIGAVRASSRASGRADAAASVSRDTDPPLGEPLA